MYKGPTSYRRPYDFVEDLVEEIEAAGTQDDKNKCVPVSTCPYVRICLDDKMYWSLLDSGSQISGISEKLYEQLIQSENVLELSVANVHVAPALGRKAVAVKKQVLVKMRIGEIICDHIFLVIPFLTTAVILGHDFLCKNGAVLDYRNMVISIRSVIVDQSLVMFDGESADRLTVSQCDQMTYLTIIEACPKHIGAEECVGLSSGNDIHDSSLPNRGSRGREKNGDVAFDAVSGAVDVAAINIEAVEKGSVGMNDVIICNANGGSNSEVNENDMCIGGSRLVRENQPNKLAEEVIGLDDLFAEEMPDELINACVDNMCFNTSEEYNNDICIGLLDMCDNDRGGDSTDCNDDDVLTVNVCDNDERVQVGHGSNGLTHDELMSGANANEMNVIRTQGVVNQESERSDPLLMRRVNCWGSEPSCHRKPAALSVIHCALPYHAAIDDPGGTRVGQSLFEKVSCDFSAEVASVAHSLTSVSDSDRNLFYELLSKYRHLFSDRPGCVMHYEHVIKPKTDKPFVRRSYPVPLSKRAAVERELKEMLDAGIIERSSSPYCSPLRVVEKKDGRLRLCLDARYLNDAIEGDNESPPLISELLQGHHGKKVMSAIDLTHGYWQVPLSVESRPYTAFLYGTSL